MMQASDIQKFLNIDSCTIFAYGFTYDRNSVWLLFYNGYVFRIDETHKLPNGTKEVEVIAYKNFDWSKLSESIKRWYNGFNESLNDLLTSMGNAPSLLKDVGFGYQETFDVKKLHDAIAKAGQE